MSKTNIKTLLERCKSKDIHVTVEGEQLRLRAKTSVPASLANEIKSNKADMLIYLQDEIRFSQPIEHQKSLDRMPMTALNHDILMAEQLGRGNAYHIPLCFEFYTGPNVEILREALSILVSRHQILNTKLQEHEYYTEVAEDPDKYLNFELHSDIEEKDFIQYCLSQAEQAFDLHTTSPYRFIFWTSAQQRSRLLCLFHHSVCDAWSMDIFSRELAQAYSDMARHHPLMLAPQVISPFDFGHWRYALENSIKYREQLDYWREQLAGSPVGHKLPLDRPRPKRPSNKGETLSLQLPKQLVTDLEELAKAHHTTLFIVMQCALATLIYRWTDETDILMATPLSGRQRNETNNLFSCLVNTCILRNHLDGTLGFAAQLPHHHEIMGNAFENQDVALSHIIEALDISRSSGSRPLAQILFSQRTLESDTRYQFDDISSELITIPHNHAKFDLSIELQQDVEISQIEWEYDLDIFNKASVQQLADSLVVLLKCISENPNIPLDELIIWENQQLLKLWSEDHGSVRQSLPLWSQFEAIVKQYADNTAITDKEQQISYQQIHSYATEFAALLQQQGIKPGDRVAIALPAGIEFVRTILAITACGAVYVPLDLSYPHSRLQTIIQDSQPQVLITNQPVSFAGDCFIMSSHITAVLEFNPVQSSLNDALNIIYTSGSTGQPKGVLTNQRGVNRLVHDRKLAQIDPTKVVGQISNLSFDAVTFEIWGSLLNGARLVIFERSILLSPEAFSKTVQQNRVNIMFMTVTLFNQYIDECPDALALIDTLIFGGEACSVAKLKQFWERGEKNRPRRLINGYGPTENSTFSTWSEITQSHINSGIIPIGKPMLKSGAWVVDKFRRPLPPGAIGELAVTGDGLAMGYWNQVELSQENFTHLSNGIPCYLTGDLVRWSAQGELLYIARNDSQIKIRGHRIEPGEIEATLLSAEGVVQAVVVSHEFNDELRLLGYVVINEQTTNDVSTIPTQLSQYLTSLLPSYMQPSCIIIVESLPLTPNGKIDKPKLPQPVYHEQDEIVAPTNDREAILCRLFEQHLNLQHGIISTLGDFFSYGGNSLSAIRLNREINEECGVSLTLADIFEYSQIQELAKFIDSQAIDSAAEKSGKVPKVIKVKHNNGQLSVNEKGLWYLCHANKSVAYNMPFMFKFDSTPDLIVLKRAMIAVIEKQETLNSVILDGPDGPYRHQVSTEQISAQICEQPYSTADISALSFHAFDLSRECPIRVRYLTDEGSFHLHLLIHHIAADGHSVNLLTQQFSQCYLSMVSEPEVRTYPIKNDLPVMSDYAAWQQSQSVSQLFAEQLAVHRANLGGAQQGHSLPLTPETNPQNPSQFIQKIRSSTESKLNLVAVQTKLSPFAITLTAFSLMLCRQANQASVTLGIPTLGRTLTELKDTIGYLVNPVAVNLQLNGKLSLKDNCKATLQMLSQALSNDLVPFEQVASALGDRHQSTSLFKIMFGWQEAESNIDNLFGLSAQELTLPLQDSKYDLLLNAFWDRNGFNIHWEFDPTLFHLAQVEAWSEKFYNCLEWILDSPQAALSAYGETKTILPEPVACTNELLDGFYRNFDRAPEKSAAIYHNKHYNYAYLEEHANRLANQLISLGLGAQSRVIVLLEQDIAIPLSLLAIIKIGATYIPLSGKTHPQRLLDIIDDSQPQLVITQQQLWRSIVQNEAPDLETLFCEQWQNHDCFSSDRPQFDRPVTSNSYIIYTSGTTGKPKGVRIADSSILQLIDQQQSYVDLNQAPTIAQYSDLSFDAATFEIWGPLLNNGTMVALSLDVLLDAQELAEHIELHQIDIMFMTTALFNNYSGSQSFALAGLKNVLFGGERCNETAICDFLKCQPQVTLTHVYGPTEVTVFSTAKVLTLEALNATNRAPIGRPLLHTSFQIINKLGQLCEQGETGELWLGGKGVSMGYLNQTQLTAEKFVTFNGHRYYRTGDLVSLDNHGDIHFIGREDKQIKVRGFRIELSEIDNSLLKHKDIESCLTLPSRDSPVKLFTFAVACESLTLKQIRNYLSDHLPEYMLPERLILVSDFPLNKNGKVDIQQLFETAGTEVLQVKAVSLTETEQQVAQIWQRSIDPASPIDTHTDFFDIGGNSLKLMLVCGELNSHFEINLSIADVITNTQLQQISEYIEVLTATKEAQPENNDHYMEGTF